MTKTPNGSGPEPGITISRRTLRRIGAAVGVLAVASAAYGIGRATTPQHAALSQAVSVTHLTAPPPTIATTAEAGTTTAPSTAATTTTTQVTAAPPVTAPESAADRISQVLSVHPFPAGALPGGLTVTGLQSQPAHSYGFANVGNVSVVIQDATPGETIGLGLLVFASPSDAMAHLDSLRQNDIAHEPAAGDVRPQYLNPSTVDAFCAAQPYGGTECGFVYGDVVGVSSGQIADPNHFSYFDTVLQAGIDDVRAVTG